MKIEAVRSIPDIKSLVCDRCGRGAELNNVYGEFSDLTSIQYQAGYRSIFVDCNGVEVDLRQHCLRTTLVAWILITDPLASFSAERHNGEFPNDS